MSDLLRQLPIELQQPGAGSLADPDVTGVAYDSRRVAPGDLFVAWRGERHDGHAFADDAVRRGAVAVLGSTPAPAGLRVPWLLAAEPRRLLGPLAARLHGHPDRELLHVGVTGTNGKSTVLALLVAILEAAGRPSGRIGTLGYGFGERSFGGERTTPEGSDYFRLLRTMRDAGAEAVVAEVSSHALAQGRVAGASFDLALFTNLTRDHLDFHGDTETYFAAKRGLFELLAPGGRAVVNLDDPYGRRLSAELPSAVGYGRGESADVRPLDATADLEGLRGQVDTPRGRFSFATRLVGGYNLDNLLAAVAGAEALGLPHDAVAAGLAACTGLPGRMELVSRRGGFAVLVDFAHTEAALRAALESARQLTTGRLIVVFGCGGDRDRGKRAPMGRAAGELSDLAFVTSDNPRSEAPEAIVDDVRVGLEASGGEYVVEIDRAAAIRGAVAAADPGALVLVAGKGHESTQILGERVIPFSDRDEVLAAVEERLGPSKAG